MYFADFKNFKIITDYNYITKKIELPLGNPIYLKDLEKLVKNKLTELQLEPTDLPVLYDFTIAATETERLGLDETVDFLSATANTIVAITLKFLETGEGYKRERRLDVPDALKPLHSSYSCVKRACNNKIITPIINIQVQFNGMFYLFCMDRTVDGPDDAEQWLHSAEGETNE